MLARILLTVCTVAFSYAASAQDSGTAEEARAMLERAAAAVQADESKALEMFNAEDSGFRDRDLYVFCANATDGLETAHPTHRGSKLPDIKDANGFAFGQEIMRTATEGQISEITYLRPRPGSETPVEKVTLYTKVGGQICAVGCYK